MDIEKALSRCGIKIYSHGTIIASFPYPGFVSLKSFWRRLSALEKGIFPLNTFFKGENPKINSLDKYVSDKTLNVGILLKKLVFLSIIPWPSQDFL